MGKNRKTYSDAFKQKVAKEAFESGKTNQEVAAANGVAPSQVTKWKQQLLNGEFSRDQKRQQKQIEALTKQLEKANTLIGKQALMLEIVKKN